MKILIFFILLTGCYAETGQLGDENSLFEVNCEYVGNSLERCENKEVICYVYKGGYAGGVDCRYKKTR